jgi:hypothetical protein
LENVNGAVDMTGQLPSRKDRHHRRLHVESIFLEDAGFHGVKDGFIAVVRRPDDAHDRQRRSREDAVSRGKHESNRGNDAGNA